MRLIPFAATLAAGLSFAILSGCGGDDDQHHDVPPDVTAKALFCTGTAIPGSGTGTPTSGPEISTGFASKDPVTTQRIMAITANPYASRAACDVLAKGGTAVDAAVAAQMVLNLTEPQSSGIGGGAFMVHYNATTRQVQTFDGRETAPAAATVNYLRWVDDATDQTTPRPSARLSGRSIGTPGVLRMLELAYQDNGRLPWRDLFQAGIDLSTNGFFISPRMAASISADRTPLSRDPEARAYFLNADGTGKTAGTVLKNPALAATFTTIANNGASAFYSGDIAQAIVAKIADTTGGITTGRTTLADMAAYQAKRRDPVCIVYRVYYVCGMGPPSSGGITVASTLGILENFDLSSNAFKPVSFDRDGGKPSVQGVHVVTEAERLAYADRDKYIADTDFVPLPGNSPATLLNKNYLKTRSQLISLTRSMGSAQPGDFGPVRLGTQAVEEHGTTHMVIVDSYGNVVSMTTTVESSFGSYHFVRGFILNNQLTDFSAVPTDNTGAPIANQIFPGKRPRSSMAPTLVFRDNNNSAGAFVAATGSPGGSAIIWYVAKTLVAALDWGLDPQQAVSMIDFGAQNTTTTNVGGEHPNVNAANNGNGDTLVTGLRALGHTVSVAQQSSGLSMLRRTVANAQPAWIGGADPRREGVVIGDVVTP